MNVVIEWLLSMLADMLINAYLGIATAIWWCVKVVNVVASYITTETLWSDVLDSLLTNITAVMPDVLQGLVYSPTGVFYMALSLSGLLLIVNRPNNKIAEAPKVIMWGVLVSALFVGSTFGYDMITYFEELRLGAANGVLTIISPTGEISDLVNVPMRATTAEGEDLTFILPAQFEDDFFAEADPADITTQDALIIDTFLFTWTIPFDIEDAGAQQARKEAAVDGLFISLLTVGPATIEGMFAVIYAAIAAATFVLIIFFVSILPLGFFSFGQEIIEKIIRQYMMMWMLTIASSVIIGVLLGSGSIFLPTNPSISQIVAQYLPILIVISIAVTYIMKLAFQVMVGTAGMVTATIRDEIGVNAYNTKMPAAGDVPLSGAAKAGVDKAKQIALLSTAAVTGGMSIAALGGLAKMTGGSASGAMAGNLMARFRPEAARDAAMLARYTSDSPRAQSFAAGAMGRNFIPSAIGIFATRPKGDEKEAEKADEPNNSDGQTYQTYATNETIAAGMMRAKSDRHPLNLLVWRHKMRGDQKSIEDLMQAVRKSMGPSRDEGASQAKAISEALRKSPNRKWKRMAKADRLLFANSGLEYFEDFAANEDAAWIKKNKVGQLGRLSEPDIARAIKLGYKAIKNSELSGSKDLATDVTKLLVKDRAIKGLSPVDKATIAQEVMELTGIFDGRKLRDQKGIADIIKNPVMAPAGADHAAMATIRAIAKANKLDIGEVMAIAEKGNREAKKGGDVPTRIYKHLNESETFENVSDETKADLARNSDLVLQSFDHVPQPQATLSEPKRVLVPPATDVTVNVDVEIPAREPTDTDLPVPADIAADVGTQDMRIVADETQRDMAPTKVEVTNDPPAADVTVNVDVEVPAGEPTDTDLPVPADIAADVGTKDVRVVEDQTQRDMAATKVEIVKDQTAADRPVDQPEAPPLPEEIPADVRADLDMESE